MGVNFLSHRDRLPTEIQHFALRIVTLPTSEPVTIYEAENHLRETSTGQRTTINNLIAAARESGEDESGRAFLTQVWDLKLDHFPLLSGPILVPRPPLQTVSSITYLTSTGGTATLTATAYRVDTDSEPARIEPVWGTTWPVHRVEVASVIVRFTCGATTATDVSRRVKQAILLTVGQWYEHRGDEDKDELPQGALRIYRSMDAKRPF